MQAQSNEQSHGLGVQRIVLSTSNDIPTTLGRSSVEESRRAETILAQKCFPYSSTGQAATLTINATLRWR